MSEQPLSWNDSPQFKIGDLVRVVTEYSYPKSIYISDPVTITKVHARTKNILIDGQQFRPQSGYSGTSDHNRSCYLILVGSDHANQVIANAKRVTLESVVKGYMQASNVRDISDELLLKLRDVLKEVELERIAKKNPPPVA